jgi:hypothetical protein
MAASQEIQVQLAEAETALVAATDPAQVAALAAEVVKLKGELQIALTAETGTPAAPLPEWLNRTAPVEAQAPAPIAPVASAQAAYVAPPAAAAPAPVVVVPKGLRHSQIPIALRPTRN